MILKEILEKANWQQVAIELVSAYPNQRKAIKGYEEVFELLQAKMPKDSELKLVVEYVEDDLDPGTFFYNVLGAKDGDEIGYGLSFKSWSEWMGMDVSEETEASFSPEQICAHCLYEMTFYGFEEETIERRWKDLSDLAEDAKSYQEQLEELNLDEHFQEPSMRDRLRILGRWLRWSGLSKEYFGESAAWFNDNFTGPSAPESFTELDRYTIKAALKQIARDIETTSEEL